MDSNREHPLYHLDPETLLVAIYVWVGHEPKCQCIDFATPLAPALP